MYLGDHELKKLLPEVIHPYDHARLGPASYDVAIGHTFRVFPNHDVFYVDIDNVPDNLTREVELFDDPADGALEITIHPGEFMLAATEEYVRNPRDLACTLMGRSSIGRLGLDIHATAGFVDPGYNGVITLELFNKLRVPIILRPGQVVAQLAFQRLQSPSENPYNGRYQGDRRAAPSRYGQ